MPRKTPMVLVQSLVPAASRRKLDALANVRKCPRASYLRWLIEMHVRAVTPKILRALDQSSPRPRP